jgi:hypothetical protein
MAVTIPLQFHKLFEHIVPYFVTRQRVWIDTWVYWTLVTKGNSNSFTELHTPKVTVTTAHIKIFSVFSSRCLVAAYKDGHSLFFGFPKCPFVNYKLLTSHNCIWKSKTKLLYDLWPTAKHLEDHDQGFFFQLNPCGPSPYVTSSVTRRRVCLLRTGFVFVKCMYLTYSVVFI